MWSGLLITAIMAFTHYGPSLSNVNLDHKTGILFAFSAFLLLPALLNYSRLIIDRRFHDILFIPLLLFFLIGFKSPFIWFIAYEGIFIILGSAFNHYSVSFYRIKYILSVLVLFTGFILLNTISSHDIAYIFIFLSLVLKYDFPDKTVFSSNKTPFYIYFSLIRSSATVIMMIKIYPVIQPLHFKIATIILLALGIISALIRFSGKKDLFSSQIMAVDSMYLPYILIASSGLSHLYSFYLFLLIPLVFPFLIQNWCPEDEKIPKGFFLTLLSINGFPLTAGMVVWVRFIRHTLNYSLYNIFAYSGFIFLVSFWIYLYKKILTNADKSFSSENKRFNAYFLTIILYNGIFWFYYLPVVKFFAL